MSSQVALTAMKNQLNKISSSNYAITTLSGQYANSEITAVALKQQQEIEELRTTIQTYQDHFYATHVQEELQQAREEEDNNEDEHGDEDEDEEENEDDRDEDEEEQPEGQKGGEEDAETEPTSPSTVTSAAPTPGAAGPSAPPPPPAGEKWKSEDGSSSNSQ